MAVITSMSATDSKEVTLKARGQSITTAVDVAEITRRRFMNTLKVEKIEIGSEELTGEEGNTRAVSFMEIILKRPDNKSDDKSKKSKKK